MSPSPIQQRIREIAARRGERISARDVATLTAAAAMLEHHQERERRDLEVWRQGAEVRAHQAETIASARDVVRVALELLEGMA